MSFPDPGVLTGDTVVLRDLRPGDAEPLAAAFQEEPELNRLLGWEADPTAESLRSAWAEGHEDRRAGRFMGVAVADRATDAPLGIASLSGLDARHRRCELGIWLLRAARGRGAAVEAMRLLTGWAFATLDLQRIGLRTLPDNAAMLSAAERAGFRFEGVLRRYTFEFGAPVDNAVCSLLREEAPAWPD